MALGDDPHAALVILVCAPKREVQFQAVMACLDNVGKGALLRDCLGKSLSPVCSPMYTTCRRSPFALSAALEGFMLGVRQLRTVSGAAARELSTNARAILERALDVLKAFPRPGECAHPPAEREPIVLVGG